MPEYTRYEVFTETRVVVRSMLRSGGEFPVGEYVVRSKHQGGAGGQSPGEIPDMVRVAMEKNVKAAKVMASAVDNTERNRLK